MNIHQSNCKVFGLTLLSRAGFFFQTVFECIIREKKFGGCKFAKFDFTQVSREKLIFKGSEVIWLPPFPILFVLLH